MASLDRLKAIYDGCVAYSDRLRDLGVEKASDVSQFWDEYLRNRPPYPNFNNMLVMRRSSTYPLADRVGGDPQAERNHALAAHLVVTRSSPDSLKHFHESDVGAPQCFDIEGRYMSAGGMTNALTAQRIVEWCAKKKLAGRPIRILEIGAGYGQVAAQLIHRLNVAEYVICDLPPNLFLSSYYLQVNFPERPVLRLEPSQPVPANHAGFCFLAPPLLDQIVGQFDLIVNSYSFQEMNAASVNRYFAFAKSRLASDGFLYSLNSHGKDEIRHPSDYPIAGFRIEHLESVRKYPFQVFATIPYELILTVPSAPTSAGEPLRREQLDAFGYLFQFGFEEELMPLVRKFLAGDLSAPEKAWLASARQVFRADAEEAKSHAIRELQTAGGPVAVADHLEGCLAFVQGDFERAAKLFESCEAGLGDSYAKARTFLYRASVANEGSREQLFESAKRLVPHLADEMRRFLDDQLLLRNEVARQLHGKPIDAEAKGVRSMLRAIKDKFLG